MPTTGSSGLNNLLSNTAVTQTTMPSWYDQAQQNIVQQAGTAAAAAPTFANTAGGQAVANIQAPNNAFTQAQNALGTIASGAANPWLVDQSTGTVSPNVNTAMGGLFQAQRDQLNQVLPSITAPAQANAIGSGNFGSLRGQTAVDKAKADALANLQAQQMTAALQGQQYGTQAASSLGNVGAQALTSGLTAGQAQMNAPFMTAGNYANLINAINAPTTASQQTQLSPLNMLGTIGSAVGGGLAGLNTFANTAAGSSLLKALFGSGSTAENPFATTVTQTDTTTPTTDQQTGDLGTGGFDNSINTTPGTGDTTGGGALDLNTTYDAYGNIV